MCSVAGCEFSLYGNQQKTLQGEVLLAQR